MPGAVPFISDAADLGGMFYGSTDLSTSGSRIRPEHSLVNDGQLTGGISPQSTVPVVGSGRTNVYVGALVLAALGGIILLHLGGFRFAGDVSLGRR